ncbi:unnamed protein product [Cladocopium goreaui]|uniref:7,8-didemethyl-8-hydroxy-5-deazariboflavin synthase n=1 Tax=Cladocopium goreaui TaxID=2562237 RepID=A0A9P1D3U6_9DINO|nr:unnamed protein product [Cladocopium goreaui]
MSAETCAHIQLPVVQSNTSPAAVLKNRRKIEDALGSASLDVLNSVTQLYDKSEARSNDNRKTVQPAMVVTFTAHHANPWHQSNAFTTGTIGPAKLIAVANMLGVDREHGPPSVGARTEQQAEFARAALERLLALRKPEVHYYGMLREEQEDVKTQLGTQLYNHWDQSSEAPPKVRPREALEAPVLQALAWNNGEVHFPDQLLNKFPANSQERSDMLKIKHELADFFRSSMPVVKKEELESSPAAKPGTVPAVSPGRGPAPRAVGRPDWSIEDGARPVQCDAPIRLEHVPAASFGVTRLAQTAMTKNKPTLVVSSTFELWVGNEGYDEITVTRDIMGFHKGDYSEKVVAGDGSGERNAVCFRLLSDKDIVSHEKVFMSLADYFHFLSATKGVAEVELMNHVMKQKTYPETPAAADGDDTQCQTDPLPVPYRYNLTALKSGLCTVFKPAALSSDEAGESKTVRRGSEQI